MLWKCHWVHLRVSNSVPFWWQIHFWGFTSDTSQARVREGTVRMRSADCSLSNSTFSSSWDTRLEMEIKVAFLQHPACISTFLHCLWLTCGHPQRSQGAIYAELACRFLFLVTAKLPSQLTSKPQPSIPGLDSLAGFRIPRETERTSQLVLCGFVHPILFHFDLRRLLSVIWVRRYGLRMVSTWHEGPKSNAQHFGLENWWCYASVLVPSKSILADGNMRPQEVLAVWCFIFASGCVDREYSVLYRV